MAPETAPLPATAPLNAEDLCRRCDTSAFSFATTAELDGTEAGFAQSRAVEAIQFSLGMARPHFNLYVAGPRGIGKHALVEKLLRQAASGQAAETDWCYVYNFKEAHKPDVMSLPAGRGRAFAEAMEHLVQDLKAALTGAFSGEDYRNSLQGIQSEVEQVQNEALDTIRTKAEADGIAMLNTPMGYGFAPVRDGKVMPPEDFNALPEDERKAVEQNIRALQEELRSAMQRLPALMKEVRERIQALNEETAEFAVGHLIDGLKEAFSDIEEAVHYLDAVHHDVTANAEVFLGETAQRETPIPFGPDRSQEFFRRYSVNLIIDRDGQTDAPVVFEDEPTYERLIGRIEHRAELGALVTDFNLIRGGALHRANGGYLVLDARKVLSQPLAWEALKRALHAREIRIEPMHGALGLPSTTTLEPEPIPLSVKVVLVGEGMLHYLLQGYDPEFSDLFKVLADFDEQVPRTDDNNLRLASLIAATAREDSLRPFDREAVAGLIDDLSRALGDSERLSTNTDRLTDLMREADFVASKRGEDVVTLAAVDGAIAARTRRGQRLSDRMQEQMVRETIMVDTTGARVGQINGLSVFSLGASSFGKPSRITARVRVGQGRVIDIEREVDLGGPLHSKGVLILSGYLGAHYATDVPLSLAASLVFEQSYGGVDGDSASSTELYALLSALSEVPIKQGFAVTGSVNQHGEIQAIGGVNEKVEGFFDLCAARGLTGDQGVLIPASNVKHLMLHQRVITAVEQGEFAIYPVSTIDQGIEILTGIEAGQRDAKGVFPAGSINARVEARLEDFARHRRQFGMRETGPEAPGGTGGTP